MDNDSFLATTRRKMGMAPAAGRRGYGILGAKISWQRRSWLQLPLLQVQVVGRGASGRAARDNSRLGLSETGPLVKGSR